MTTTTTETPEEEEKEEEGEIADSLVWRHSVGGIKRFRATKDWWKWK
jgi:hypothetical protein